MQLDSRWSERSKMKRVLAFGLITVCERKTYKLWKAFFSCACVWHGVFASGWCYVCSVCVRQNSVCGVGFVCGIMSRSYVWSCVWCMCVGGVCAHVYVFLCVCFMPVCSVCSLLHLHLCGVCVVYGWASVCLGIRAYGCETVPIGELCWWWQSAVIPLNDLGLHFLLSSD